MITVCKPINVRTYNVMLYSRLGNIVRVKDQGRLKSHQNHYILFWYFQFLLNQLTNLKSA